LTQEESETLTPQQKYYRFLGQLIVTYRDSENVTLIRNFDELEKINTDADLMKLNNGKPVDYLNQNIIENLKKEYFLSEFVVVGVDMVGPSVGSDLRAGAINAVIFATIGILIYITIRFKFIFGFAAVVALMHDVIITIGFYALSGKAFTLSIVAALLTIVGYSLNDTIVVCDRIRENVNKHREPGTSYEDLVSLSINQTLSRTLLTSSTTLLVLTFLLFFGGEVLSGFSFAMLVGMIAGTYSSDCLVSPILVVWNNFQEKHRGKEKQRGTEYVKHSLKTLFPDKRDVEKIKVESDRISHDESSITAEQAAFAGGADDMRRRHGKRKKGITGRKKKRHR
jgi:preprotein translocase subunit SecF